MGGGRATPTPTATPAIVGIGTTNINTKSIVPKNNVFILLPPFAFYKCIRHPTKSIIMTDQTFS
jgi:hypothetical protein